MNIGVSIIVAVLIYCATKRQSNPGQKHIVTYIHMGKQEKSNVRSPACLSLVVEAQTMVQFTAGQVLSAKRAIQRRSMELQGTPEAFSPWEWKQKILVVHSCLFGVLQALLTERREVMLAYGVLTILGFHWDELETEPAGRAWQHDDFGFQDELVVHPGFTELHRFSRVHTAGRLSIETLKQSVVFLDKFVPLVEGLEYGSCLVIVQAQLKRILEMLRRH